MQPKFRFGRDCTQAELPYHRLGMLWNAVKTLREQVGGGYFAPPAEDEPVAPVWLDDALHIAEAIRKHYHVMLMPQPAYIGDEAGYTAYIDRLRQFYRHIISIIPANEQAAKAGRLTHQRTAQKRARQAQANARIGNIPIPAGCGESRV